MVYHFHNIFLNNTAEVFFQNLKHVSHRQQNREKRITSVSEPDRRASRHFLLLSLAFLADDSRSYAFLAFTLERETYCRPFHIV
jgi:hypothetical protein